MIDKAQLLGLLRNSDEHVSGQFLCSHFGVSRNAIWKIINQLRKEGYDIEAVPNRGYKLNSTPDILSKSEIESRLETKWAGRELVYYDSTDSTNIRARRLAEEGAPEGTLVVSDMQTLGRGRRGRTWLSPSGSSVYMSLLLRPRILPQKSPMLTLVMALAVTSAIEKHTGLETQIKWPNDIVIEGGKVCGILTEMDMEADYIRDVIIGVGINVNQTSSEEFDKDIRDNAVSIRMKSPGIIDRAALTAQIMSCFEKYYDIFIQAGDLSPFKEEYNKHLANFGKRVRVHDPAGEYEGTAHGITDEGELIVESDNGEFRNVYAGEVSVRGLYGYV